MENTICVREVELQITATTVSKTKSLIEGVHGCGKDDGCLPGRSRAFAPKVAQRFHEAEVQRVAFVARHDFIVEFGSIYEYRSSEGPASSKHNSMADLFPRILPKQLHTPVQILVLHFFLPWASVALNSRINTLVTPSGTSSTPSSKPGLTPTATYLPSVEKSIVCTLAGNF